jgi:hypothetical protein
VTKNGALSELCGHSNRSPDVLSEADEKRQELEREEWQNVRI